MLFVDEQSLGRLIPLRLESWHAACLTCLSAESRTSLPYFHLNLLKYYYILCDPSYRRTVVPSYRLTALPYCPELLSLGLEASAWELGLSAEQ